VEGVKALIIQKSYGADLGNLLQIARAEGAKVFHEPNKIKVLHVVKWYPYGWIMVVQNGEGSISENEGINEYKHK